MNKPKEYTPPLLDLFQEELNNVIDKYRDQGLTVGEAVGAMEMTKLDLWMENQDEYIGMVVREEWGDKLL